MRNKIVVFLLSMIALITRASEVTPTDFTAEFKSVPQVKEALQSNGFTVLGTHAIAENPQYTSVLYTAPELRSAAQLPLRGFAGVMRILVDKKDHTLVLSNPEYYLRAFLQKDYKKGMEAPLSKRLNQAFGTLQPTEDQLKTKKLANYRFMIGMPRYDNFQVVAKGDPQTLCKKLETNAKDRIVFKLDLSGDGTSVLYGVALPKEIEQFNEKLGTMNHAQLLPYTVWIEGGEARILHAKYYLALSFPRLSMGEFMKIMSIPGDIKDQFESYFK